MKVKVTLFLTVLLIFICCIGAASAAEDVTDDAISSEGDATVVEQADSFDDATLDESTDENEVLSTSSTQTASSWSELQSYCNATGTDYTINLNGGISIGSGDIQFGNNAVINGNANSYITGDASGRIPFTSTSNSALQITFQNVNFRNIQCQMLIQLQTTGTSILNNCTFTNITAGTGHDSVVYNNLGTMNITDCTFSDCTSGYGVVSNYMSGSTTGVTLNVRGSTFENNYASTEPGCINNCGQLYVWASTFNNNRAAWWAGAIHTHTNAKSVIRTSSFNGNVAGWNGGALYTYSTLEVYDSNFTNNNCTTNNGGGAIGASNYFFASNAYSVTVNNCRFVDNNNLHTSGNGGAIAAMNGGTLNVNGSTFIHNYAANGQAICGFNTKEYANISEGKSHLIITHNTFINHTGSSTTVKISGNQYTFDYNTFINSPQTVYSGTGNVYNAVSSTNSKVKKELLGASFNEILSDSPESDDEFLDIILNNLDDSDVTIYLKSGTWSLPSRAMTMSSETNVYIIGEDRDSTIFTTYGIYNDGNAENWGGTITWENLTFNNGEMALNGINYKFINCKFINYTLELNAKESSGASGAYELFDYSFTNCNFVDYIQNIITGHNYTNIIISNCVFDNINSDAIISTTCTGSGTRLDVDNHFAPYTDKSSVTIKDSTFNNVIVKGIVDAADNVITDNTYGFDTKKTLVDGEYTYIDVPVTATTLTVKVGDIKEGEPFTIIVELSDNITSDVKVSVGENNYTVSVVNGTGSLKVSDKLAPNTYNVTANFEGISNYAASTANTTFKVEKVSNPSTGKDKQTAPKVTKKATKITAKKATFKAKKKTKKYSIVLKAGKAAVKKVKVTIKIGKKTYKATTNSKGKATFKITKLTKKGKYTAVIKFAGNKNFKATSKKVKITVKK